MIKLSFTKDILKIKDIQNLKKSLENFIHDQTFEKSRKHGIVIGISGGIDSAVQAYRKLTQGNRDDLYESNVNPIATFPGQGVTVFGQKTTQKKASALDRVNVRRLLINLKKFVANSSRTLVFEQNTSDLRNQFLNTVQPYMEQVQANQGLNAFRVVMDDSNNTPETIDRNMLVGQIFLQPAKTAEFIVLDFVVQPTGAAFPE